MAAAAFAGVCVWGEGGGGAGGVEEVLGPAGFGSLDGFGAAAGGGEAVEEG